MILADKTYTAAFVIVLLVLFSSFHVNAAKAKALTLDQIHQRVAQQFKGKIISSRYATSSNVYTINLLQHDGTVKRLRYNATTGKLISRSAVTAR